MKPSRTLLSGYIERTRNADRGSVKVSSAGKGCHGEGYLVEYLKRGEPRSLIVKSLDPRAGLGHDHPPDRAAVLLTAHANYNRLPRHVKSHEVIALGRDGGLAPLPEASEYYLVMDEARGEGYFADLERFAGNPRLDPGERRRIRALAGYLAGIHKKKKDAPGLYLRRLRDTIGHGECLMGVFDTYGPEPPGFTCLDEMADIEARCVRLRAGLKCRTGRLSVVHGDFHPGNILFSGPVRFMLLDRSRGEFGEPADDVTALTINFVFYSLIHHGRMEGAYDEAMRTFFSEYLELSGDRDIMSVLGMFYAFRGAVVANPQFYPDVDDSVRSGVFGFVHGVLGADNFDPAGVNGYISNGRKYRKRFDIG